MSSTSSRPIKKKEEILKDLELWGVDYDEKLYKGIQGWGRLVRLWMYHGNDKPETILFKPDQNEIEFEVLDKIERMYKIKYNDIMSPTDKEEEMTRMIKYWEEHYDMVGFGEIRYHDKLEVLELERKLLRPRIKRIVDKLYKKVNATHEELSELLWCYNKYYKRNDSWTCSACTARAYESLKNIIKG